MIKEILLKREVAIALFYRLQNKTHVDGVTIQDMELANEIVEAYPERFWIKNCSTFGEFVDNNQIKFICNGECAGCNCER